MPETFPYIYPETSSRINQINSQPARDTLPEMVTIFLQTLECAMAEAEVGNFNQIPSSSDSLDSFSGMVPTSDFLANLFAAKAPTSTSAPSDVETAIDAAAQKYGVPSNLILGVIKQESGMNPSAVSRAGAVGLMQLMPETGKQLGASNLFDPVQNIDAGTHYLANLLNRYHGNIPLALAAYNAGPGAVDKYGGVPPYQETEEYVQNVQKFAEI
jgi:soluble lytic murein transglycosylase-like protein